MKTILFWALTVVSSATLGFYLNDLDYYRRYCSVKDRAYDACLEVPNADRNACLHLLKPGR